MRAFHETHRKYIYDDCCELELWPASTKNLPIYGAYEANLGTASLKSQKTNEVASHNVGKYPSITSLLPQLESNESE